MSEQSQCASLLRYLKKHKSITPLMALDVLGIYRLAGRIFELRQRGFDIKTTMIQTRHARVARYSL